MKHLLAYYVIIFLFLTISVSLIYSIQIKKAASKTEKDEISDEELDELLKDPKYASIAKELGLPPSTPKVGGSTTSNTSPKTGHLMSSSNKNHFERKIKGNTEDQLGKISLLSKNIGSDPLKDIEMLGGNLSSSKEKINDYKAEIKKPPVDDKFKSFDFISKQQAQDLLDVLKQPALFNTLPPEAQTIVKASQDISSKLAENSQINNYIEASLINTPNSESFIDPDGMMSRKGMLTLIDPVTGESKSVWAVSNAKVLSYFLTQNLSTIIKLYRNSRLVLKDIPSSPCFFASSTGGDKTEKPILTCASSNQEKDIWMQTVKSHLNLPSSK